LRRFCWNVLNEGTTAIGKNHPLLGIGCSTTTDATIIIGFAFAIVLVTILSAVRVFTVRGTVVLSISPNFSALCSWQVLAFTWLLSRRRRRRRRSGCWHRIARRATETTTTPIISCQKRRKLYQLAPNNHTSHPNTLPCTVRQLRMILSPTVCRRRRRRL